MTNAKYYYMEFKPMTNTIHILQNRLEVLPRGWQELTEEEAREYIDRVRGLWEAMGRRVK